MSDIIHGVHHIGLKVKDYDKSLAFYREGLGFEVVTDWEHGESGRACILDMGNCNYLEMGNDGGDHIANIGKFTHFALTTSDINAAYDRAIAHGGKEKVKPTYSDIVQAKPKPWKLWFAYVIGPDGEEVEIIQNVDGAFKVATDK